MARDENGVYELPAGNPVIHDTTIESDWANETMEDLKNALTDSLSRTGRGNMEAQFKAAAGSAAAPGVSFANSPTAGMNYNPVDNTLTFSINGVAIFTVNADAVVMNESCVLSEDATANMQAVTKQQLDAEVGAVDDAAVKKAGDFMSGDLILLYENPLLALNPLTDGARLILESDSNADASRISHNNGAESSIDFSISFIELTVQSVLDGEIRLTAEHVLLWKDATQPMGAVTKQQMEAVGDAAVKKAGDMMTGDLVLQYPNPFLSLIPVTGGSQDGAQLFITSDSNADASRIVHNYGLASSIDFSTEFIEVTVQGVSDDGEIRLSAKHVLLEQDATQPMGAVTKQQMDAAIAAAIAAIP